MKALVVGYGSIGKRHAAILIGMGLKVAVVSRRNQVDIKQYSKLADALKSWQPDYVVLASRTSEHAADLETLSSSGFNGRLLIEKPLLNDTSQPPDGLPQNSYIAYNLRFHPAVVALRSALASSTVHTVHAYVGQYLPDWRPGTDYRESYSAQKSLGGGVLRDLSHEIDLINWLFGPWRHLTAAGGKFSDLEIDTDDTFTLILNMESCPHASISMNYLDARATRYTVLQTDKGTLRLDLIAGALETDGEQEIFSVARDDTYHAEHKAILEGRTDALCDLNQGIEVMNIILSAEKASRDQIWVAN